MNINEIESLWEGDSKIDPDNLHLESIKIPSLHSKYHQIHNNISLLKKIEENKLATIEKEKWLYYSGKASPEVYKENPFDHRVMKQDLDKYLRSDEDIVKVITKIQYFQLMLDYLESILKTLHNRTFVIKNAIDWSKFAAGYD